MGVMDGVNVSSVFEEAVVMSPCLMPWLAVGVTRKFRAY
jgi:hypothetical protein